LGEVRYPYYPSYPKQGPKEAKKPEMGDSSGITGLPVTIDYGEVIR
jgi:hypothetical protein